MTAAAELVLRPAMPADLATVQRLYQFLGNAKHNTALSQARAEQFVLQLRAYPGSELLVGLLDGHVVTTATLIVIPNLTMGGRPYGLIENVATDAGHRKRGYATALLKHAAERAFLADCYKVMLMTGSKDPATLRFYEKAGFEQSKTGFQMRAPQPRQLG